MTQPRNNQTAHATTVDVQAIIAAHKAQAQTTPASIPASPQAHAAQPTL